MNVLRFIAIGFLMLGLQPPQLPAQAPTMTLVVHLLDYNGKPLPGQGLFIEGPEAPKGLLLTDSAARCSIQFLPGQTYTLFLPSMAGGDVLSALSFPNSSAGELREITILAPFNLRTSYIMNIPFNSPDGAIPPEFYLELNRISSYLKAHPSVRIQISAHRESIPELHDGYAITERWAQSVGIYLVSKGISPIRIIARGYGDSKPIFPNSTQEGKAKNRRIEIVEVE